MITQFFLTLLITLRDVLPILALIIGFQMLVLRQPIPRLSRVAVGVVYVVVGLALFLVGLEMALFPLGQTMAAQLSDPEFLTGVKDAAPVSSWQAYGWIYCFAGLIGFATTIAEPSLIAVAYKAHDVSAGTINKLGLRLAVAFGVAIGIAIGAFRIVHGSPLYIYILIGYIIVIVQTVFAPKQIVALAYDSGGVTTSTVTVPIVAALGLGLSEAVPGRDPALDGFGLIAFASLFPIISVMAYAQQAAWRSRRRSDKKSKEE
ncbi:MAG: DUF1538 domain-containing protein [Desulfocapsaceae bacterium]|nr:DUF1538 domain-containing protein [Desulfocapsaceae bacterium]